MPCDILVTCYSVSRPRESGLEVPAIIQVNEMLNSRSCDITKN